MKSSMDALSLILSAMILFASMVLPLIFFNWRVSSARPAARTPLEVLQEEMAEMKRQIASRLLLDDEREAFYSELTARFKSSKDETAVMREEIKQLKADLLWHQKAAAARWDCESYDTLTEAEFNQNMPITNARRADRHLGGDALRKILVAAEKEMCKAAVIALRR